MNYNLDINQNGEYINAPVEIKLNKDDSYKFFGQSINNKTFKITDKGIYSISKPHLSNWILRTIISNLEYSTDYIKNNLIITDATAGLGGDLIQFSKYFKKVNGVELNKVHFDMLQYNVHDVLNLKNVFLYHKNYLNIYNKLENHIVYIDPPWGGKGVVKKKDLMLYLGDKCIYFIINKLYDLDIKYLFLKIPHNFNYHLFLHKINYNLVTIFKNRSVWLIMLKK